MQLDRIIQVECIREIIQDRTGYRPVNALRAYDEGMIEVPTDDSYSLPATSSLMFGYPAVSSVEDERSGRETVAPDWPTTVASREKQVARSLFSQGVKQHHSRATDAQQETDALHELKCKQLIYR